MSDTQLGGTFPDYANMGFSPEIELQLYAVAIWGHAHLTDEGEPQWWRASEVGEMVIGSAGAITNGIDYFVLDDEVAGLKRLIISPAGEVWGTTQFYRSTESATLKVGKRAVFWL